ncbi:hypothetical protein [Microbacterium sp. nov. GSS16]|uniref:hypothetical protein n=1 Tax=Microbacterium sp. nov. GSS16 TaxID=3019890 RepID=UPI002305B7E5|nr:hypothetical protein [Microbacterium sp. nov. GSS16]WCD91524.1 hypothetical protein PGB26_07360 [Microbacterium sp. nov. GSS16]
MSARGARSVLFLSSDLVGSTSFKQKTRGWQKIFLSFYRELPQMIAEANREIDETTESVFHLWKAVGDELVFEVEIASEADVSRAVRVWLRAMAMYEDQVLSDRGLALKGGAFIATFPGPDSESTIPRKPEIEDSDGAVVLLNKQALTGTRAYTKYLYDYFGPSIDTGFRLFGLSSRRYFTMSIETAWAMAAAARTADTHRQGEDIHYMSDFVFHGSHLLKGVWDGREYPVFAIDREQGDPIHKALAGIGGGPLTSDQVIDLCHACASDESWPFALYLPSSDNEKFTAVPEDAMAELYASETSMDGAETEPENGNGDGLDATPPLGGQDVESATASVSE